MRGKPDEDCGCRTGGAARSTATVAPPAPRGLRALWGIKGADAQPDRAHAHQAGTSELSRLWMHGDAPKLDWLQGDSPKCGNTESDLGPAVDFDAPDGDEPEDSASLVTMKDDQMNLHIGEISELARLNIPTATDVQTPYPMVCRTTPYLGATYKYNPNGGCAGSQMVKNRFWLAHQVVAAAASEIDHWGNLPESVRREMWNRQAYHSPANPDVGFPGPPVDEDGLPVATLSYWFGDANADSFGLRWARLSYIVRMWEYRFRHGFYNYHNPVYLRCKQKKTCAGYSYHRQHNTITLCKGWFDIKTQHPPTVIQEADQATIIIHEMGHHCTDLGQPPWDRRHGACGKGRCYQALLGDIEQEYPNRPIFVGGDPRDLVLAFENGSESAMKDMMWNIDNYQSWFWNRWMDRGRCRLVTSLK